MIERQELWCHECKNYVQFDMDLELNGNHVLECPVCGHEHCRVVEDGKITEDRWDQRNGNRGNVYYINAASTTWSSSSTFYNYTNMQITSTTSTSTATTGSAQSFLYSAWMNRGR